MLPWVIIGSIGAGVAWVLTGKRRVERDDAFLAQRLAGRRALRDEHGRVIVCPACEGQGVRRMFGRFRVQSLGRPGWNTCPMCEGFTTLTEQVEPGAPGTVEDQVARTRAANPSA